MSCKDCPVKIVIRKEGADDVTKEHMDGIYQCTIGYSPDKCPAKECVKT